jgi:ornithine decarboxylase
MNDVEGLDTPFFTISKSKVLEQYKIVSDICDMVSYSSKTNPKVSGILEENTSAYFSVHLINELKNIKDKSKVIFLAQAWDNKLLNELVMQGIEWFVVDNVVDLEVFENYLENCDKKLNILLRWKLKENSIRTEKYYVFGMETEIVKKKVLSLRKNEKINFLGIHFHRKTQNLAEWNFKFELINSFDKEFWEMIDYVNIGGGLPSVYTNTNIKVFNGIYDKLIELKNWFNSLKIKLIIEPGRFIAAPSGKLHTKIIGIHENTIIVDASVYNGDLDALVVPVKLLVENELNKNNARMYIIKGVTPCSMDIFRYRVYLKEKKVGEKIVFINAGAYNFNSDFCDMRAMKTIIVD